MDAGQSLVHIFISLFFITLDESTVFFINMCVYVWNKLKKICIHLTGSCLFVSCWLTSTSRFEFSEACFLFTFSFIFIPNLAILNVKLFTKLQVLTSFFFVPLQVIFLMYHYFNAREIYNVGRVCVAAYVWMTGFGNFSYYYARKDFSLSRFAQACSPVDSSISC